MQSEVVAALLPRLLVTGDEDARVAEHDWSSQRRLWVQVVGGMARGGEGAYCARGS
jgi:hypothetical protein